MPSAVNGLVRKLAAAKSAALAQANSLGRNLRPGLPASGDVVGNRSLVDAKELRGHILRGKVGKPLSEVHGSNDMTMRNSCQYPVSLSDYLLSIPLQMFPVEHCPMDANYKQWRYRLRAHMKDVEITQEQLAEKLGRTQGAIAHWLKGTRQVNLDEFFDLCKIVKADAKTILFGEETSMISMGERQGLLAELKSEMRDMLMSDPTMNPYYKQWEKRIGKAKARK